eukprot:TRINITY_DN1897_c0_g1_i9.p1 TRINITY_DN1897_c0_g1~~TRINITY_DN1897_c0_g1_i9.p1  ORF type:complete len:323 (-),score=38.76 TRINITY_DN1897_c0_g1_i9:119-1003(-)
MRTALVFIFALVCSISCQWTDSVWTDTEFGGSMYLCIDGDEVHGAYTEYGLVNGHVDGDEIEGFWYEGGGDGDCLYGPFSWTISNNGNSFSGWWSCIEDDEQFDWSESRTGGSSNTNTRNCAVLAHDNDFAGSYLKVSNSSFSVDLCIDDDEYNGSYEYETGNNFGGYEYGVVHQGDHGEEIGSGIWVANTGSGISLMFRLSDGSVGNFWWEYDDEGDIDTFTDFHTLHDYDIYQANGNASDSECAKNDYLLDDDNNDDNNDYSSSSEASIIATTCLFSIVLAFIQQKYLNYFK